MGNYFLDRQLKGSSETLGGFSADKSFADFRKNLLYIERDIYILYNIYVFSLVVLWCLPSQSILEICLTITIHYDS